MSPKQDVIDNIERIFDENIKWSTAIRIFYIQDPNLQKVYIRYIYQKIGYTGTLIYISQK